MFRAVQLCRMFRRASPSSALLVVIVLCNFPTAHAMDIPKYNIIHCLVFNHWLNKLGGMLHAPSGSVASDLYRNSIVLATGSLANHLYHQSWIV